MHTAALLIQKDKAVVSTYHIEKDIK